MSKVVLMVVLVGITLGLAAFENLSESEADAPTEFSCRVHANPRQEGGVLKDCRPNKLCISPVSVEVHGSPGAQGVASCAGVPRAFCTVPAGATSCTATYTEPIVKGLANFSTCRAVALDSGARVKCTFTDP